MTLANITSDPLRPRLRATRWLAHAVDWIRAELHAAQVEIQDEQFLATGKGMRYRRM
jgi:hypothetical protein